MTHPFRFRLAARTDTGRVRTHNEDNFVLGSDLGRKVWNRFSDDAYTPGAEGMLLMVADGMGGMQAGDRASALAVGSVETFFTEQDTRPPSPEAIETCLREALLTAHAAILAEVDTHPARAGMGTTAVLAWVVDAYAYLAWVGDSRVYLFTPERELVLLTADHSLVWEMVESGLLDIEAARLHPQSNIITQSLGELSATPEPDVARVRLAPGSRLLLCSDGLHGIMPVGEIQRMLARPALPRETCEALVAAANAAGGTDNITVILLDVLAGASETETGTEENFRPEEPI